MAEEPTGRYVVKFDNKPLAARKFHLYKDCGMVKSAMDPREGPSTLLELDESLVTLLGVTVCLSCDTRSKTIDPEDLLAEAFGVTRDAALHTIGILEQHGYRIRQERKTARTDQDQQT